ncbi:uncharacterized protein LOC114880301 isoform X2 [Osmia bicornis bicornis]|uniref:uncharacterized protein LOC114880301 isoform X2 n=1 Tax=Osmia bicornis bicornis TaxID=1437191 RepID=UPI0010F7BA70|nr:uncharacterized protein LOC114880301 isoform X2 [Osmia bicornis bicornis]
MHNHRHFIQIKLVICCGTWVNLGHQQPYVEASALYECIAETQDWRKCQEQVKKFKVCMDEYQRKREKSYISQ